MAYKVIDSEKSSDSFLGKRGLAQLGARTAESLLGLPGDIANLGLGATNWGIQKLTGEESPLPTKVPLLQTSQDIRQNVTEPLSEYFAGSKEYIAPQSKAEEFLGEFIGDLSTLALPVKGKIPFKKALTITGAGGLGGFGGETLGSFFGGEKGRETGKTIGKIGGMITGSLLGGRNVLRNKMKQDYQIASEMSGTDLVDVKPLRSRNEKLIENLSKRDFPNKDFVLDRLETVKNVTESADKIPLSDLTRLKADLNKFYPSSYGDTRKYLDQIIKEIKTPIEAYGKQNPAFGTAWRSAEDTFKAIAESNGIAGFFKKHPIISKGISNKPLKYILSGGGAAAALPVLSKGLPVAAGIGSGLAANEMAKFLQLVSKSPASRQIYSDMLKNASLFNVAKVARDAKRLDNIISKEESKKTTGKFRIVED